MKKNQTLPLEFEKINLKEAGTKFENIILCYPFNPLKVDIIRIPWMSRRGPPVAKPFCGIIELCHKEGFILFSDWLPHIANNRSGFYSEETIKIRQKVHAHLATITPEIDYVRLKDRIVVNNAFKELNFWLQEMYNKIGLMDEKGGWEAAYEDQIYKHNKIATGYKQYRINKEQRLKEIIEKYKEKLKNLESPPHSKFTSLSPNQSVLKGFSTRRMKPRKIPKNLGERERIRNKLERYEYNESRKFYQDVPLKNEFESTFHIYHIDSTKKNLYTSEEFEEQINEIFRLIDKDWVSLVNGKLMFLGNSAEEIEEKLVFKILQKYPRVDKHLEKDQKNIIDGEWNNVPFYCCKAIESFYMILLKNKKKYENKTLSQLTKVIREKKIKLFRDSVRGVKDGIDHLILSTLNLVGSIRNQRDSGHDNLTSVPNWEAKMCYSYTLLLIKTLHEFKA